MKEMIFRKQIEQKIEEKKGEIAEYQSKILESEASVRAFQEVLKVLPRKNGVTDDSPFIRETSLVGKARKVIMRNGSPMHINKIMDVGGFQKEKKQSLSGMLTHYVRRGKIFTRPAPGTYGLTEFGGNEEGPPEGFDDL